MKNHVGHFMALVPPFAAGSAKAQTQSENQLFSSTGISADYSLPLGVRTYTKFEERLVSVNRADFELQPGVWDWTLFDKRIGDHSTDS